MSADRYDQNQKLIEDAALAVFIKRGFDELTLEAVAEQLGYTKQAIYYYFRSKEELVTSMCMQILETAYADIERICAEPMDPAAKMATLIRQYLYVSCRNEGFFALHSSISQIMHSIHDQTALERMRAILHGIPAMMVKILSEGVEAGVFRKADPVLLSRIMHGALAGIVTNFGRSASDAQTCLREAELVADIILRGILA